MSTGIDDYIDSCPEALRKTLQSLRQTIREAAPEAKEAIKYDMPAFTFHGNLVFFALFKKHIGFYGASSALESFEQEVSTYKTAKGTLKFPLDQPLPLPLIRKIVELRVKENMERPRGGKARSYSAPRPIRAPGPGRA